MASKKRRNSTKEPVRGQKSPRSRFILGLVGLLLVACVIALVAKKPATSEMSLAEPSQALIEASEAQLPSDYLKYFPAFQTVKSLSSNLQMYMSDLFSESQSAPYSGREGIERFILKWDGARTTLAKQGLSLPNLTPDPNIFTEKVNDLLQPRLEKDGWWFQIDLVPDGPETSRMTVDLGRVVARKKGELVTTEGRRTPYSVQLVDIDAPEDISDARTVGTTISIFPLPQWRSASVVAETLKSGHSIDPTVDRQLASQWNAGTPAAAIYTELLRYIEDHEIQHVRDEAILREADSPTRSIENKAKLKVFFEARGYIAGIAYGQAENAATAHLCMIAVGDYGLNTEGATMGVRLMDPSGRGLPLDRKILRERAVSVLKKTDSAVLAMAQHASDPDPYEYGRRIVEAAMKN